MPAPSTLFLAVREESFIPPAPTHPLTNPNPNKRYTQRLTEHLLSQDVPALISRGVLAHLAQSAVQGLGPKNSEALREVGGTGWWVACGVMVVQWRRRSTPIIDDRWSPCTRAHTRAHTGGVPRAGEGPRQRPGLRGRGACIQSVSHTDTDSLVCRPSSSPSPQHTPIHQPTLRLCKPLRTRQDYTLRTQLFEVLRDEGAFKEAATVLAGLNLDSVSR